MPRQMLGQIEKHFWLTRSVARSMGISFTEVIAEGRLSAEGYAALVTRCRAAGCSKQCAIWLAKNRDIATSAPEFCANADQLAALR